MDERLVGDTSNARGRAFPAIEAAALVPKHILAATTPIIGTTLRGLRFQAILHVGDYTRVVLLFERVKSLHPYLALSATAPTP